MNDRQHDSSTSQLRHELRTPLNQIIGYAQMMIEQAEEQKRDAEAADLRKIEAAGQRLIALIDVLVGAIGEDVRRTDLLPRTPALGSSRPAPPIGGRLLVVDDNELNRDMLARRLRARGYEVASAGGGAEALRMIGEAQFDLLLLDVMMPEISGLDVLQKLRETLTVTDLPVIMATAKDQSRDVVTALRLGANDYVVKPLDFNVVLARVETQLSLKRASDEVKRLNLQLNDAQERISWLLESSARAVLDVGAWSQEVAAELTRALAVGRIIIYDERNPADADHIPALPAPEALRAAARARSFIQRQGVTVVPVTGMSGAVLGALIVEGKEGPWGVTESRLIASFAHQLGGAIELQETRRELADSEERNRSRRKELIESGYSIVQVCRVCHHCFGPDARTCQFDQQLLESPYFVPYVINDRYRLVALIGQGGMGSVFEAHDQRLDRKVAIKVISADHFDDPSIRLRFEQEARIAARIGHPGVTTIFDSGELPEGSGYIIMELLVGSDVAQMIRRFGPGTPSQVASLLRQASSALTAAHRAGLIHRDIKPENIFLEERQQGFIVKLLDFGIAKAIDLDTHLTHGGTVMGTPAYMAPEQLWGKTVDARSDLYSFAAVAFEALVGRGVTLERTLGKVIVDVMQCDAPRISTLIPGTPAGIDEAFCHALAKDSAQRPTSVEEWVGQFVETLEAMSSPFKGWPQHFTALEAERDKAKRDSNDPTHPYDELPTIVDRH